MDEVCANIGPRGIRQRNVAGAVGLIVSLAIFAALVTMHAPRASRGWLVLPLFVSALGFFQAGAKTCVALAAAGKREPDTGDVVTERERAMIQRQMVSVVTRSAISAIVITSIVYLLPV